MGAPEMHPDLYAEHMTGDAAYDKAFAALADCPSFTQVETALKTYAHELAEKIRYTHHPDREYLEAEDAADLIDPGVTE
jgi:hypothetical protein